MSAAMIAVTNNISDVLNVLENVDDVSYARWVRRDDRY